MPIVPPSQSSDIFDIAQQFLGNTPESSGFDAPNVPSTTGLGTRTGRLPSNRNGVHGRKSVYWLTPSGPIIQMYINPETIRSDYSKGIESQRTKGGFVIQYWGENLTTLNISGTTGTSGIEGINVLYDIYRNEQLAFDPYALFLAAKNKKDNNFGNDIFGFGSALAGGADVGDTILGTLTGAAQDNSPKAQSQAPTLASLACQVEMYWSGEVYRGFFTKFTLTESSKKLGMFDYDIGFTVTQKRGLRTNFLGWHRSATHGPSSSSPQFGTPYSYGSLIDGQIKPPKQSSQPDVIDEIDSLGTYYSSLFG